MRELLVAARLVMALDTLKKAQGPKKPPRPWYHRSYPVDNAPHPTVVQAVGLASEGLRNTARDAGLPEPVIHYTTRSLGDHLARYLKGSMNGGGPPVFVINPADHYRAVERAGADHEAVVATSLYHELGHAICDHHGVYPSDEEGVVEDFAHTCYTQGGDVGLRDLHHVITPGRRS